MLTYQFHHIFRGFGHGFFVHQIHRANNRTRESFQFVVCRLRLSNLIRVSARTPCLKRKPCSQFDQGLQAESSGLLQIGATVVDQEWQWTDHPSHVVSLCHNLGWVLWDEIFLQWCSRNWPSPRRLSPWDPRCHDLLRTGSLPLRKLCLESLEVYRGQRVSQGLLMNHWSRRQWKQVRIPHSPRQRSPSTIQMGSERIGKPRCFVRCLSTYRMAIDTIVDNPSTNICWLGLASSSRPTPGHAWGSSVNQQQLI